MLNVLKKKLKSHNFTSYITQSLKALQMSQYLIADCILDRIASCDYNGLSEDMLNFLMEDNRLDDYFEAHLTIQQEWSNIFTDLFNLAFCRNTRLLCERLYEVDEKYRELIEYTSERLEQLVQNYLESLGNIVYTQSRDLEDESDETEYFLVLDTLVVNNISFGIDVHTGQLYDSEEYKLVYKLLEPENYTYFIDVNTSRVFNYNLEDIGYYDEENLCIQFNTKG